MRRATFIVAILLVVGGLVALLGLLWKHDLGSFATSPQMIEVPLGTRRIAGGRALVAAHGVNDTGATLIVSCREASTDVDVGIGEMTDPACGVTLTYLTPRGRAGDPDDPLRAVLEVRWQD
jgi:hypothetical protein